MSFDYVDNSVCVYAKDGQHDKRKALSSNNNNNNIHFNIAKINCCHIDTSVT